MPLLTWQRLQILKRKHAVQTLLQSNWKRCLSMKRQNRINQLTDQRVRLNREWGRHRFTKNMPHPLSRVFDYTVSSIEQEQTHQHGPQSHEVGAKVWSNRHIDAEDDQNRRDQHSADASHSRRFLDVAGSTPK